MLFFYKIPVSLNKLSQKAILLYENSSKKQIIGPIILNDYISNFKEIILILGNKTSATVSVVDLMEKTFHTDSIIYNEDATSDNQKGDYSLITHGEMYGFATCYFRKSKKEIYIAKPLNVMSVLFKVYGVY